MTADWKALYGAARAFQELAPWRWMGDSELYGVRDPRSGKIGWCTVMGGGGEFFGLGVYLGERGFDLLRKILDGAEFVEDLAAYGQDALCLNFVDRRDVQPEQLARLREQRLKPRGRNAWPVFESHEQGRVPIALREDEVPFMLDMLLQTMDLAQRLQREPELLDPTSDGRLLVRAWNERTASWKDERVQEPGPFKEEPARIDQLAVKRSHGNLRRIPGVVQCDVFSTAVVIDDGDVPAYVPATFLSVEAKSGLVVQVELGHPNQRAELAQRQLLVTFDRIGAIPATVMVRREEVEAALAPLAATLHFDVLRAEQLPTLDEAREALDRFTMGAGPPRPRQPRKKS
jgi:hypothetical protein